MPIITYVDFHATLSHLISKDTTATVCIYNTE